VLESVAHDVWHAVRQLRRSPGFALVAILSLALGIGANAAIFQLVDTIRLKMLPVRDPQSLVNIDFKKGSMRSGWFSSRSDSLTYAQWEQIQAQQQAFSGVFAWSATRFNLADGGEHCALATGAPPPLRSSAFPGAPPFTNSQLAPLSTLGMRTSTWWRPIGTGASPVKSTPSGCPSAPSPAWRSNGSASRGLDTMRS
jgi:hypothetical protein